MKKLFFFIGLISFLAGSCNSEDDQKLVDAALIDMYIKDNNITAMYEGDDGLYYIITEVGDSADVHPTETSEITVKFTGYFLDGIEFDSTGIDEVSLELSSAILGWQIGIPKLTKDGKGTLLIPSHLAYGSQGTQGTQTSGIAIPPNTVLAFDIELIDFQ